ncbi:hypothetical protein J6590_084453 [Homalodisca vitripennis]|nr:hypothetical protein J6590_084453 [Homalodisca vitripennis]
MFQGLKSTFFFRCKKDPDVKKWSDVLPLRNGPKRRHCTVDNSTNIGSNKAEATSTRRHFHKEPCDSSTNQRAKINQLEVIGLKRHASLDGIGLLCQALCRIVVVGGDWALAPGSLLWQSEAIVQERVKAIELSLTDTDSDSHSMQLKLV